MTQLQPLVVSGCDELLEHADRWDDLWERSDVRQPACRAELIDQWCATFADRKDLRAVVLSDGVRWVAGLPLVLERRYGIPWRLLLTTDCWSIAGDLLVDPAVDLETACRGLVDAAARLAAPLLSCDLVEIDSDRWQTWQRVLAARRVELHVAESYHVGVVDILHDWDAYQASWSGNHRQSVRKSKRRLETEGTVTVERITEDSPALEATLRTCFEIEDRSWKGQQGSSVLQTPGMFDYFLSQARTFAAAGMLELWLLRFDGRIIAFEYCQRAKGTVFSQKISYDPDFQSFGPGRLLRYLQLERLHGDRTVDALDTLGILCSSKAKWSTRSYRTGRIVAANGSRIAGMGLTAAKRLRPFWRSLRPEEDAAAEATKLGAARVHELVQPASGRSPDADRPIVAPAVSDRPVTNGEAPVR